jgi:hypothetical protein
MDPIIGDDGLVYASPETARGQKPQASEEDLGEAIRQTPRSVDPSAPTGLHGSGSMRAPRPPRRKHVPSPPDARRTPRKPAISPSPKKQGHTAKAKPASSGKRSSSSGKALTPWMPLEEYAAMLRRSTVSDAQVPQVEGRALTPWMSLKDYAAKLPPAIVVRAPKTPGTARQQPGSPSRRLVRCPVCTVSVREDRLQGHQLRVHPERMPMKASGSSSTSTKPRGPVGPGTDGLAKGQAEDVRSQGRRSPLDASPDGGAYRDHGAFGSAPSYDGFGDEDGP